MKLTREQVLTMVKTLTTETQELDERIFSSYILNDTSIISTLNDSVVRLIRKEHLIRKLSYLCTDREMLHAIDMLKYSLDELRDDYIGMLKTQIIKLGGVL